MRSPMKPFIFDIPLTPGSITTWDELTGKFLQKIFSISKTIQLRREIDTFKQLERESFYKVKECFKILIKKMPTSWITCVATIADIL
ncbi:NADH--cytochrome b5 reductase 1-like [Gossypium australe]|uniref:NADH--cytochrome b5 reductase 1-like n=1 Tax=Gossypium australe TaxID=47621 RepID=A0A5B6WPS3_9ROSI|nr:NADH--cytochrome b5 reductase 1-like [Gossypium australe]